MILDSKELEKGNDRIESTIRVKAALRFEVSAFDSFGSVPGVLTSIQQRLKIVRVRDIPGESRVSCSASPSAFDFRPFRLFGAGVADLSASALGDPAAADEGGAEALRLFGRPPRRVNVGERQ